MSDLLTAEAIQLHETAADKETAIRRCGEVLTETGAVSSDYTTAMLKREESISTYVGEGVAIPHGTAEAKSSIKRDSLAVVRFPAGVDWGGETVHVCVAIAAQGDGHVSLLAALAEILLDSEAAAALRDTDEPSEVIRLLESVGKETH